MRQDDEKQRLLSEESHSSSTNYGSLFSATNVREDLLRADEYGQTAVDRQLLFDDRRARDKTLLDHLKIPLNQWAFQMDLTRVLQRLNDQVDRTPSDNEPSAWRLLISKDALQQAAQLARLQEGGLVKATSVTTLLALLAGDEIQNNDVASTLYSILFHCLRLELTPLFDVVSDKVNIKFPKLGYFSELDEVYSTIASRDENAEQKKPLSTKISNLTNEEIITLSLESFSDEVLHKVARDYFSPIELLQQACQLKASNKVDWRGAREYLSRWSVPQAWRALLAYPLDNFQVALRQPGARADDERKLTVANANQQPDRLSLSAFTQLVRLLSLMGLESSDAFSHTKTLNTVLNRDWLISIDYYNQIKQQVAKLLSPLTEIMPQGTIVQEVKRKEVKDRSPAEHTIDMTTIRSDIKTKVRQFLRSRGFIQSGHQYKTKGDTIFPEMIPHVLRSLIIEYAAAAEEEKIKQRSEDSNTTEVKDVGIFLQTVGLMHAFSPEAAVCFNQSAIQMRCCELATKILEHLDRQSKKHYVRRRSRDRIPAHILILLFFIFALFASAYFGIARSVEASDEKFDAFNTHNCTALHYHKNGYFCETNEDTSHTEACDNLCGDINTIESDILFGGFGTTVSGLVVSLLLLCSCSLYRENNFNYAVHDELAANTQSLIEAFNQTVGQLNLSQYTINKNSEVSAIKNKLNKFLSESNKIDPQHLSIFAKAMKVNSSSTAPGVIGLSPQDQKQPHGIIPADKNVEGLDSDDETSKAAAP